MRVIAGTARGKKLNALPGEDITRPTIDRVKEAVFSSLQFVLPGARVLDLFAGSGQLGIEALSRGAESCVFVDRNPDAIRIIRDNCENTGVMQKSRIVQAEAENVLKRLSGTFHVVLLDPPYRHDTLAAVLPGVAQVCAPGAAVICESELDAKLPEECEGLVQKKQHRYGKILITRYEKGE